MKSATRALAKHIVNTGFDSLPGDVVREAKRRVADVIAAGLSGSTTPVGKRARDFAAANGRDGKARIWGFGVGCSPAYAAMANGTMAFHLELDDVHRSSHTHPGVTTIPAAIATAEAHHLSGRDLIAAVVLGYDAQIRIGLAVSPSIYVDRTFLAPGTLGVFGAAAAVAKLMKLDEDGVAGALGTASYIGPLAPFESFRLGAPAKDTIMGWANFSGLNAAELARTGFGGPETAIEGDYGFARTVAARYDMDRLHSGLGSRFDILRTGFKPYACCRQHHTAIDAVLELKQTYGLTADRVASIRHKTFVVGSRGTDRAPTSIPAAKYSAPFTIALAMILGRNQREQYCMDLIRDPAVLDLASRVDVLADMELEALYDEKWPSVVEVTTKDGRVLSARRDLPKGEPEHPLTDDELKRKYVSLATDAVSAERAEAIWATIAKLEDIDDVNALTSLL